MCSAGDQTRGFVCVSRHTASWATPSFMLSVWKWAAAGREELTEAELSRKAAEAAVAPRSMRNWAGVGKLPCDSAECFCR